MPVERSFTVPPGAPRHVGAAANGQLLMVVVHVLGLVECVIHSTSATPYRRLVSLIVLVIVLVLAARMPMPELPELPDLPTLNPLPLMM